MTWLPERKFSTGSTNKSVIVCWREVLGLTLPSSIQCQVRGVSWVRWRRGALVEKPEHVYRGGQSHNESKRKKSKNPEMFKRKPDDIFKYCKGNYNQVVIIITISTVNQTCCLMRHELLSLVSSQQIRAPKIYLGSFIFIHYTATAIADVISQALFKE